MTTKTDPDAIDFRPTPRGEYVMSRREVMAELLRKADAPPPSPPPLWRWVGMMLTARRRRGGGKDAE